MNAEDRGIRLVRWCCWFLVVCMALLLGGFDVLLMMGAR